MKRKGSIHSIPSLDFFFFFTVCDMKYSKLLVLMLIASSSPTVTCKIISAWKSVTGLFEVVNKSQTCCISQTSLLQNHWTFGIRKDPEGSLCTSRGRAQDIPKSHRMCLRTLPEQSPRITLCVCLRALLFRRNTKYQIWV